MASLSEFLQRAVQTPFAWGRHDCFLFMADWVREKHGFDPAEAWRGRYSSPMGARKFIIRHGGPVGLVKAGLSGRLPETKTPKAGDIGLIMTQTAQGFDVVGAIRTKVGWAHICDYGIKVVQADPLMAWGI